MKKILLLIFYLQYTIIGLSQNSPSVVNEKQGRVLVNGKYGYYDNKGNEIIPPIYEELPQHLSEYNVAKKHGKHGVITNKSEIVVDFLYKTITMHDGQHVHLYLERKNENICGLYNLKLKKFIIDFDKNYNFIEIENYKKMKIFFRGSKVDKETAFFDSIGNLLYKFPYANVKIWDENYLIYGYNKKGVLNWGNKILIEPNYELIQWIDNDIACIYLNQPSSLNTQAILFDLKKKVKFETKYKSIRRPESDGSMIVYEKINDKSYYGIINKELKEYVKLCCCDINYDLKSERFEVKYLESNTFEYFKDGKFIQK